MADAVEETFDVNFNNPLHSSPLILHLFQSGVVGFVWPESMRVFREDRLIDLFQKYPEHLLHELVIARGNTERTHLAILFGDVGAPYRGESVLPGLQHFYQVVHPLFCESVQSVVANTLCHGTRVGVNVRIAPHPQNRIFQ